MSESLIRRTDVPRLGFVGRVPESGPLVVEMPDTIDFSGVLPDGRTLLDGRLQFDHGTYGVIRLQLHSTEITAADLRAVPLGRLVVEAVRHTGRTRIVRFDGTKDTFVRDQDLTLDERVFALFYLARAAGENANVVIAEELGITPGAAAQRVSRLRKQNVLPPARAQGAHR